MNETSVLQHTVDKNILYVYMGVNIFGFVVTLINFVCLLTIKTLNTNLRGTLLSFSFANLFGVLFFLWDSLDNLYELGIDHEFSLLIGLCYSVLLTFAHLLCLVLAEYTIISAKYRHIGRTFNGLMVMLWIICVSLCSLLMFTKARTLRIVTVCLILLPWFGFTLFYLIVMKKQRNRKVQIECYIEKNQRINKRRKSDIMFPRFILVTYYLCSLPLACKEAYYVAENQPIHQTETFIMLIIYSVNFIFISSAAIYLRTRSKWKINYS